MYFFTMSSLILFPDKMSANEEYVFEMSAREESIFYEILHTLDQLHSNENFGAEGIYFISRKYYLLWQFILP